MGRQRVAARDKQRKCRKRRREAQRSGDKDDLLERRWTEIDERQLKGDCVKEEIASNDAKEAISTDRCSPSKCLISDAVVEDSLSNGDTVPPGVSDIDADTRRIERMRKKNQRRKEARKMKSNAK